MSEKPLYHAFQSHHNLTLDNNNNFVRYSIIKITRLQPWPSVLSFNIKLFILNVLEKYLSDMQTYQAILYLYVVIK